MIFPVSVSHHCIETRRRLLGVITARERAADGLSPIIAAATMPR